MNKKKILFCSPHPLDRKLGASKVIMEVADEMEKIGWECRLASDREICPIVDNYNADNKFLVFKDYLKTFLLKNASEFDVVEYDHVCLPFPRKTFTPNTLFVARSLLLTHHFEKIALPRFKGFRSAMGSLIKGPSRRRSLRQNMIQADLTLSEADLINVANNDDKTELISRGFNPQKIAVIPLGLTAEKFAQFKSIKTHLDNRTVVFIGTFDVRKGGRELPDIAETLKKSFPEVRIKLLGARYRGKEEVLSYFPRHLHGNLEVISQFDPDTLPELLSDCSIGIFPSYIEGFGLGVLEMLAGGIPVIAYDAPGPNMVLSNEYLVPRGDYRGLCEKVLKLLKNPEGLESSHKWALTRSQDFKWETFAKQTSDFYLEKLNEIQSKKS